MESEINDILDCKLDSVEYTIENTSVRQDILEAYLEDLKKAKTVYQLNEKISNTLNKIDSIDAFKSCDVEINPGKIVDSALVKFHFAEKKWWALSAGFFANSEGGRTESSATIRNLRSKADETTASVEYKPNTKTYGFNITHHDKFFIPQKWESLYVLKQGIEELDVNLKEAAYKGSFLLRSTASGHSFEAGRAVRTNIIKFQDSSIALLNQGIPVNAKNYISHNFRIDTRNDAIFPKNGNFLEISNELAYGKDNIFHKVDLKLNSFYGITNSIAFELALKCGFFIPWSFSKISLNDRYRARYIKGFRAVGHREYSANPSVISEQQLSGDDLGKLFQLILEGKFHFYDFPYLDEAGLVPFVYGNAICEDIQKLTSPRNYFKEYARASIGFGIGWRSYFGRIEFAYTAASLLRRNDIKSEFQIIFSD